MGAVVRADVVAAVALVAGTALVFAAGLSRCGLRPAVANSDSDPSSAPAAVVQDFGLSPGRALDFAASAALPLSSPRSAVAAPTHLSSDPSLSSTLKPPRSPQPTPPPSRSATSGSSLQTSEIQSLFDRFDHFSYSI